MKCDQEKNVHSQENWVLLNLALLLTSQVTLENGRTSLDLSFLIYEGSIRIISPFQSLQEIRVFENVSFFVFVFRLV